MIMRHAIFNDNKNEKWRKFEIISNKQVAKKYSNTEIVLIIFQQSKENTSIFSNSKVMLNGV